MFPATAGSGVHTIYVRHNMEVAHRLFLQPGKCQNLHGHSMQIKLSLRGDLDEQGIFAGIDFSDLKKLFRGHIDAHFDHHLLLNYKDPYAKTLTLAAWEGLEPDTEFNPVLLPGLVICQGDPTTEHLSMWICQTIRDAIFVQWPDAHTMIHQVEIDITETGTNGATYTIGTER